MINQKNSDSFVLKKVEEITKEAKNKRAVLNKYQEMYGELFNTKQELPPLTSKKNEEFLDKIASIQRELRPGVKHNIHYDNVVNKLGSKSKPIKVNYNKMSIEPLYANSSRAKISQVKEIEDSHKTKTNRDLRKKIPFTVIFIQLFQFYS